MTILDRLSFQLYSARNFPPLDDQLATLAGLGYRLVEPYGGLLDRAEEMAAALRDHRLAAPSSHVALPALKTDFGGTVAAAKQLGTTLLIVPAIPPGERDKDAEGWRGFGRELADLQAALAAEGIRLAWHNHDFEFRRTAAGLCPLDLIFEGAPALLWAADIGWIERAGEDSADWIGRHRDRIVAFHIKDLAPAGENLDEDGWADIGRGTIDWPRLLPAIQSAKAELFVLEHDNPNDFERFATRSRDAVAAWAVSA
ncbi:MAG: sugar phosphate isomerase/epimerase [Inquilinus sp.]|nr:sugar phosphate isomerase/epimerase [Inquilinus sp.]